MSAADFSDWVGLGRRQFSEAGLRGTAQLEHDLSEDQQDDSPPQVDVNAQAAGIEYAVVPRGNTESYEDDAEEAEHQAHGNAQIEIHGNSPQAKNMFSATAPMRTATARVSGRCHHAR